MRKRQFFILFCLIAITFTCGSNLYALPEGEIVVSGTATFDRTTPNTLNINTPSNKLIVNYNSFSIAQPETVNFYQPSSSAIALNRVVGIDPSSIFGKLTANGRIFLINPNGIVFGPSSQIDVAGLVASTLDISNEDFLNDNFIFNKSQSKSGASILNQGYIRAKEGGLVALLGSAVENSGLIETSLGSVVLAAGEKITLNLDTAGMISVVIDEPVKEVVFGPDGERIDSAIKNSGEIIAPGSKVTLAASVLDNIFDYAINNSGIIEACSLVEHDGVIELVASGAPIVNTGTLMAGEVKVEVENSDFINEGEIITDGSEEMIDAGDIDIQAVNILQSGLVSANAYNEGNAGEVEIISEISTVLDENSTTSAACPFAIGNGGRIYINSLRGNTTVFNNALIDVSAGSIQGDAGFIEVSAYAQLGFYGILSGRAPPGYQIGTAILDPASASIGNSDFTNPADGIWGTIFNIDAYVWATGNITIFGDVTIGSGYTLYLLADHASKLPGNWDTDGIGAILNPSDYTISAAPGATNTSLNLKAGSGIGEADPDHPIKTNVHNLSTEINPNSSSGNIYIDQVTTTSLTVTFFQSPSGRIVQFDASGNLTIQMSPAGPGIQAAIDAIGTVVGTSTINVAAGTYNENITIDKALTLLTLLGAQADVDPTVEGGRTGDESIIDGGGGDTVIKIFVDNVTVNGFTITNGYGSNIAEGGSAGGGILCDSASPIIKNNIITNNYAENTYSGYDREGGGTAGGGIACNHGSSPIIEGNIIKENHGYNNQSWGAAGGGISVAHYSEPEIRNNIITYNLGDRDATAGGVLCIYDGSARIESNIITHNEARSLRSEHSGAGGGITCYKNSHPYIINNLIAYNTSEETAGGQAAGGIFNRWDSYPTIENNTIVSNSVDGNGGKAGGIWDSWWLISIHNNIIWDNTGGADIEIGGQIAEPWRPFPPGYVPGVSYCDFESGYYRIHHSPVPITNGMDSYTIDNINADPLFVDADNGDFHLMPDSPCIDTGTNTGAPEGDIEGNLRPIDVAWVGGGAIADMGAYEFAGRTISGTISGLAAGIEVALSKNGGEITTVNSGVDGTFTFHIPVVAVNDYLLIFVNNAFYLANLIGITQNATSDITNLVMYTDRFALGDSDGVLGNSFSNTNLTSAWLNNSNVHYSVSGGTATFSDGIGLWIPANIIYVPGGNINASGDWINEGAFTHGNKTVTLDGSGLQTLNAGGTGENKSFYNLTFNGDGSWVLQDALDVDNNLTLTKGTLDPNGKSVAVDGSFTNSDTIINTSGDVNITAATITTGTITNNAIGGNISLTATSGDITIGTGTVTSSSGKVDISSEVGSIYADGSGPHIEAALTSYLSSPNGVIGTLSDALNISISGGGLVLDIGDSDTLDSETGSAGTLGVSGNLSGAVSDTITFNPNSYTPLYPPGYVFFKGIEIWPDCPANVLSAQLSNLSSPRFAWPVSGQLQRFSINTMEPMTSVYFYHPITTVDTEAFEGFQLTDEMYEYIDGVLRLREEGLSPWFEEEIEKRRGSEGEI